MGGPGDIRSLHFYLWIGSRALLFMALFALVLESIDRMVGGWGIFIGVVGGIALLFAVLLGNAMACDWLNLRVLRRGEVTDPDAHAGAIGAVSGMPWVEGDALLSPFSGQPCAAFSYSVNGRRRSQRSGSSDTHSALSLLGFAMRPTVIETSGASVRIQSFPVFDAEFRRNEEGDDWGNRAREMVTRLAGGGASASESGARGHLLEVQHNRIDSADASYFIADWGTPGDRLAVQEEILPVDDAVTLIGTLESDPAGISGRRRRWGGNLVAYRGEASSVRAHLEGEMKRYRTALAILVIVATTCIGLPYLPGGIIDALPLLHSLVKH